MDSDNEIHVKFSDFNEIHISVSDFKRETSKNERPLATEGNLQIFLGFLFQPNFGPTIQISKSNQ